jgi:hypothetical protein
MLLILLACSDAGVFKGNASDEANNGQSGDDTATLGPTNDTGQPAYWTLAASLEIEAGLPHASKSSVTIDLLDADTNLLCTAELPVLSAGSKPAPDDAIYAWWALGLEPSADCDVGVELVLLGIGEMNADVEAGIASIGYDDTVTSGLNGAYFAPDSETEWAFGVAGLEPTFKGGGEQVDGPPIPDGTWLIKPLYPFPI